MFKRRIVNHLYNVVGHMLQLICGKRLHNYGPSPFSLDKSTISMVIFNSKLFVSERDPFSLLQYEKCSTNPALHGLHSALHGQQLVDASSMTKLENPVAPMGHEKTDWPNDGAKTVKIHGEKTCIWCRCS